MAERFQVGDKVESIVHFLRDGADPDCFSPDDCPEVVDVWPGRVGTVVEVSQHNELRIRWSHRKWIDGWIDGENVLRIPTPTARPNEKEEPK